MIKLRHSWQPHYNYFNYLEKSCSKCGCIKRWDDYLNRWIFIVENNNVTRRPTNNIVYNRPSCIHPENAAKLK